MHHRPTVIFDFDGTVALGDGPVLAYARAVERLADLPAGFSDEIGRRLAAAATTAGASDRSTLDAYDLVRISAAGAGVDDEQLAEAYLASRALLGGIEAPVEAPAGLPGFLDTLGALGATRVLVTNAPPMRIESALTALGLHGRFDRIVTDAAKPAGLARLLDELEGSAATDLGMAGPNSAGPAGGIRLLSIGDVWRNDLAPAHERGYATALVGRFADADATPTFRAETIEALYPDLTSWLTTASLSDVAVNAGPVQLHTLSTASVPDTQE